MKRLLKLVMFVVLCAPSGLWAMDNQDEVQIKGPSQQKTEVYFLKFKDKPIKISKHGALLCQVLQIMLKKNEVKREENKEEIKIYFDVDELLEKVAAKTEDILTVLHYFAAVVDGAMAIKDVPTEYLSDVFKVADALEAGRIDGAHKRNVLNELQKELTRRPMEIKKPGPSKQQETQQSVKKGTQDKSKELSFSSKKPTNVTHYFITFNKTEFPVSFEVLNQFEVYKKQTQNIEKFGDKETIRVLKKSASLQDLNFVRAGDVKSKIKTGTTLKVVWDITKIIDRVFKLDQEEISKSKINEIYESIRNQAYEIDLKALIPLMINIASGKMLASTIEDKEELFLIIKIADLLGNTTVMQQCTPALMERLMGNPLQDYSIRTFTGHTDSVVALQVLQNGTQFLSASWDNTIRLWNINPEQGQVPLVREFTGHKGWVFVVQVLQNGTQFLSASRDNTIRLWNINPAQGQVPLVREFTGHKGWVVAIQVLQNGTQFLSASIDGTIRQWNIKPEQGQSPLVREFAGHANGVYALQVLQSGTQFLSGSKDGTIQQWNIKPEQGQAPLVREFTGHTGPVLAIQVLQNGTQFLSASMDGTIRLWNIKPEQGQSPLVREFTGHTGWVLAVQVLQNGTQFLSGSGDKTIRLWNINPEQGQFPLVREFIGYADRVTALQVLRNGTQFLSGSDDNTIRLWNINFIFAQITLCYHIFTSEKPVELVEGSDDHEDFLELPQVLREHIVKLGKIKIVKTDEKKK